MLLAPDQSAHPRRSCAPLGRYHWSVAQAEYATDIIFRSASDLAPLYDHLLRTAIHAIKADDIATFLGRSPATPLKHETGGDFSISIHGTRVRHYLGPASIKMYDKHGFILRVETTTNDVSFFRHHRMVEQRDGQRVLKLAQLKKSIYSLFPDLASISRAANDRYIQFLSAIDDPTLGLKALSKISDSVEEREHHCRGFNFFDGLPRSMRILRSFRSRDLRSVTWREGSGRRAPLRENGGTRGTSSPSPHAQPKHSRFLLLLAAHPLPRLTSCSCVVDLRPDRSTRPFSLWKSRA